MKKLFRAQNLLWLALALALTGSLTHVAWGFATLEQGNLVLGYIQAIAVDVGLFAIAVGIQQNRAQGRPTGALWGGVFFFSAISTYANLLHGLAFASPLVLPGWEWLVALRPFLLSAVLPILVVYLAEVAAVHYRTSRETDNGEGGLAIPQPVQAAVFLDQWFTQHGREATVPEFVHFFAVATGLTVDEATADQYILEWRRQVGRSGARPKQPLMPLPLNGNGAH